VAQRTWPMNLQPLSFSRSSSWMTREGEPTFFFRVTAPSLLKKAPPVES